MKEEPDTFLTNLEDAGCRDEEVKKAKMFYEAGDIEALIRYLRKCRCSRMEELHENQRKVDCLDYLIRQTEKAKKAIIG